MVRVGKVMGIYMVDHPGSLNELLKDIRSINANIDYLYITFDRDTAEPIAVISCDESDLVENSMVGKGHKVVMG